MSSHSHAGIDLTPTQQRLLRELVTLFRETDEPVKGAEIAESVDRNPGTVRNQMQSLKTLQLVEGIPGPRGGYKPTATAFETLAVERVDEPAEVPLSRNGASVDGAVVEEINLTSVLHPDQCRAEIELQGSTLFSEGDDVAVGPTPLCELRIDGVVDGVDTVNSTLVLEIDEMTAPGESHSE